MALYLQNGHLNFVTRIKNENTIARDELPFPCTNRSRCWLNSVATCNWYSRLMIAKPLGWRHRHVARPTAGRIERWLRSTPLGLGLYRNDHHFQGELRNLQLRVMGMGLVYRGKLNVAQDGDYTFNISADAATELKINTRPVTSGKAVRLQPARIRSR